MPARPLDPPASILRNHTKMKQSLNQRELATVLAALRYWQREGLNSSGHEQEIATNEGEFPSLNAMEIDALCERINAPETDDAASKCWLLYIRGDVEPVVMGPYQNDNERLHAAKQYRQNESEDDGLYRVDVEQDGTPEISPFVDEEFEDGLVVELAAMMSRGESAISRIRTSKYFTYRFGSDEVLLDEDLLDQLENHFGEDCVIVEALTQSYILPMNSASKTFCESAWKAAVRSGPTNLNR